MKKGNKNILLIGGATLLAGLAYLSTAKKITDLSVTPIGAKLGKISKGALPIKVSLAVTNPNQSAVTVSEINGNISLNGSIIGAFAIKQKYNIPGKNARTTLKDIPINVLLQETGLSWLTAYLSKQKLTVNVSGYIYAESKQYPFNKDITATNG
jgi:LEA14-like dessication related protein